MKTNNLKLCFMLGNTNFPISRSLVTKLALVQHKIPDVSHFATKLQQV